MGAQETDPERWMSGALHTSTWQFLGGLSSKANTYKLIEEHVISSPVHSRHALVADQVA